jgi:hypothetical protein
MAKHRARKILERYDEMKREKAQWLPLYQLIGQYVFTRKQHFTTTVVPGQVQNAHVFDDTAIGANALMAASLIGAMWPNGAKSFRIGMPFGMQAEIEMATGGEQNDTEEIKKYYEWTTKRMAAFMDNPKCGFTTALEEYMLDQGSFGISGINADEQDDYEIPLTYRAVDAKITCIDEGHDGFVNTVYIERSYTVRQLVERYGVENVSKVHQDLFEKGGCTEKVSVLQAIEPRMERDPWGFGTKNMPISSIHIDIKNEKILKESGYHEMPVAVSRFWKAMGEKYARSPAMNALSSILEANALGEAWTLAVEKTLDPSLLVMDDGSMGNGTINTSPGGITVVSVSGRLGTNQVPIQPLFLVGDLKWTAQRRIELVEAIKNHFFQDRLLDLNNEQRMTLGEANIRNELRGQTLNTVYSRQMAELFTPLIERTFNVLRRKGLLGVRPGSEQEKQLIAAGITPYPIPQAVLQRMKTGQEVYEIQFISPATRIMQAEELQGIEHTLQVGVEAGGVAPQIIDNIDMDFTVRRIQELTGAPSEMINSMEVVVKVRKAREQMQKAMMEAENNRQNSETARNMGQAVASVKPKEGAA